MRNVRNCIRSTTGSNETLIKDFTEANIPSALGDNNAQIVQAVQLVLGKLKQHPNAEVSFTRHSLGGGLAT